MTTKFVYITGHGLRPFKIEETYKLKSFPEQYRGKYKLPKNVRTEKGKKWIGMDYWFTEDQIITK